MDNSNKRVNAEKMPEQLSSSPEMPSRPSAFSLFMKRHTGNIIALLMIVAAFGLALYLSGYWPTQTVSTVTIAQQEQQAPPSASGSEIRNETAKPAATILAETAKPKGKTKTAKSKSHKKSALTVSRAGETRLAEEVYELTQGFTGAFDEGDLNTFLSFFSKSATENNILTYEGIRETYGDLFEKRLYRFRYSIGNTVAREKEKSVIISGSFVMKGRADDGTDRTRKGTLTMTLERENGKLRIKRLQKKYD